MSIKKIWTFAIVFGMIATGIFYFTYLSKGTTQQVTSDQEQNESVEEAGQEGANESAVEPEAEVLSTEDDKDAPNFMIPPGKGKRGISIEVNVVNGVSGFLKPGAFVDLVSIMEPPTEETEKKNPNQHAAATLLLQNVKVLAIGHAADTKEEAARYALVTLEVNPTQGLALGFATRDTLYLMLRGEGDDMVQKEKTHIHEDALHEGVFR
ncbi:pilus assembly protein CpaB [Bacillus mesophilus]|uniref:Flp pilus assembly protein CpaB n=1 Tax=Bacillus mesophilus TaxID=1808955 RepID=A0A6M0Q7R3_9BACI|nr:Flp pilus assembly protein CpaB [Bacillus mesophilus]MBM7661635.1 pilus assembly protein CpaB [Bacillus mesophilus]NEY72303.1 Flp pilus assembly protein CpaB [Bacillus mesophilus]